MKMTNTPLANKIKILSEIHMDYHIDEDNEWSEFLDFYEDPDNRDSFAMALSIRVGYVTPTERGIEILDALFDEVCEQFGVTEDKFFTDRDEIYAFQ
jgi:transcriptional regulator with XRE-family HTH domain